MVKAFREASACNHPFTLVDQDGCHSAVWLWLGNCEPRQRCVITLILPREEGIFERMKVLIPTSEMDLEFRVSSSFQTLIIYFPLSYPAVNRQLQLSLAFFHSSQTIGLVHSFITINLALFVDISRVDSHEQSQSPSARQRKQLSRASSRHDGTSTAATPSPGGVHLGHHRHCHFKRPRPHLQEPRILPNLTACPAKKPSHPQPVCARHLPQPIAKPNAV